MGEVSPIAWTDATFNPWWGCARLSPGCAHCYADNMAKRFGSEPLWGPDAARKQFGAAYWAEPLRWNRKATKTGQRLRVFCGSMCDVFEDRPDLVAPRAQLRRLVQATKHLDWLLLTKRPENAARLWQEATMADGAHRLGGNRVWTENVWLGTSVENQAMALVRIPILTRIPAAYRFLSCEPLLEAIDLEEVWAGDGYESHGPQGGWVARRDHGVDWVIVGGESGPYARPCAPAWLEGVVTQCRAARVPVFVKQLGAVFGEGPDGRRRLRDHAQANPSTWPASLRIRELPRWERESAHDSPLHEKPGDLQ